MRSGRPRLRSGARAPDFPFVIVVRLRLPSDSLGRIEVAHSASHRRQGLRFSRIVALLDLWSGHEICRAAKPRPRGRPRLAFVLLTVWRWRFALVVIAFLVVPHGWGWGGDGRRGTYWFAHGDLLARRPSGAGNFVGIHGIRAARRPVPIGRQFNRRSKSNGHRKRESGIGLRKTARKPRKAARAAGTRRAPTHPANRGLRTNTPRHIKYVP